MMKDYKQKYEAAVRLIESFGGNFINEDTEAEKNIVVESLKSVSESLDLLDQNITIAINKIDTLGNQGENASKLKNIEEMVDNAKTWIAEVIASVTGMRDEEEVLGEGEDNGVIINADTALKDPRKVKQFADNDINVIIRED